jgi:hypothetical protein
LDKNAEIRCPYCDKLLAKWLNPEQACWNGQYQYVCFNDDCSYFVRGWRWMLEQFKVTASYRFRFDPDTGDKGPLPVWSKEALRANIIPDERANIVPDEGGPSHA